MKTRTVILVLCGLIVVLAVGAIIFRQKNIAAEEIQKGEMAEYAAEAPTFLNQFPAASTTPEVFCALEANYYYTYGIGYMSGRPG